MTRTNGAEPDRNAVMHNSRSSVNSAANHILLYGAALGNCVHVAGLAAFLQLAEAEGFHTRLLGAAVSVDELVRVVESDRPGALAVSYRLTPRTGQVLLDQLLERMEPFPETKLLFGGTRENAEYAASTGRFLNTFVGEEPLEYHRWVFSQLRGETIRLAATRWRHSLVPIETRLDIQTEAADGSHVPLLRHHFGLPNLNDTVRGIEEIADSGVLDVISVAPDQNAQEFFFRPSQMNPDLDGAGGVPLRSPEDLRALYRASQRGNYPLLRIYSGTQDLVQWAELSVKEIGNAWGTIPLTWYSEIDGRSRRSLREAIAENVHVMQWYADRELPLEVNESHHWSLRDAPDAVAIAMAFIAAYVARSRGVRRFLAQYMFNTPRYTSGVCDLAKMQAKLTLIEALRTDTFFPYRQCRAGLSHFSNDLHMAKGQLANATMTMLGLRPHILHVVGFSEASHAAGPEEVIESCKIVRGVVKNAILGMPDPLRDARVSNTSARLLEDALRLLNVVHGMGLAMGSEDPFADPHVIATAIEHGLIDAPHLRGQPGCLGEVVTLPIDGRCQTVDRSGASVLERDRILRVLTEGPLATKFGTTQVKKWLEQKSMESHLGLSPTMRLAQPR